MILMRKFALLLFCSTALVMSAQTQPSSTTASAARPVGTVKVIEGNAITLTSDAGTEVKVLVSESTRMVRTAPGQKDLKDAAPIQLPDLQTGDRILVRGKLADDGKTVLASSVVAMKKADIAEKQKRETEDWQKRGVGGLVKTVDTAGAIITVSTTSIGGAKAVAVHLSKDTIIRRYAPDSVKFDDATLGKLDEIKPGDQLRARGTRTADGAELTAEEIVSGSFMNIAGTISATDPVKNTITVLNLATKKQVVVRISPDSQMHKIPPMIANGLAMRLRGTMPGTTPAAADARRTPAPAQVGERRPGGFPGGSRPNGGGDLQQILSHLPKVTVAEMQKGEAVMIVTTQGTATTDVTAITLLSGVEPLLTAPQAATLLSPWNLAGGGGESEGP
jgi:Domain of unknown function (DUF5666)